MQFEDAVWLPLRVFEQLARFAGSPAYLVEETADDFAAAAGGVRALDEGNSDFDEES